MNGDRLAEMVLLGFALTLPLSALIVRRVPPARAARLALLWAAIIVGAALLIGLVRTGTRSRALPNAPGRGGEHLASNFPDHVLATTSALHNIYYQDG